MKLKFLSLYVLAMGIIHLHADEYRWTKIKDKGEFKHENLGFSSTGYDRVHNLIYSMKYVDDTLVVMAYDIHQNVFIEIPNQGAPSELRTFTYDYTNDRLIAVRSGRENLYALSSSGGEWTQIATGSFDNESYNAGYFWNNKTQAAGFVGGYGLYKVNNWVWEYKDQWVNTIPNDVFVDSSSVPMKRCPSLILGKPGENKVYFASGYGNASGSQFEQECTVGEPWANDIGKYCWLKDIWELDLNTNKYKNILPLNHDSYKTEGAVSYNHDDNSFVKIGGFIPPNDYIPGYEWGKNQYYTMQVTVFKPGRTNGFEEVKTVGDIPPTILVSQLGQNAVFYDGSEQRILYFRADGIWSLSKSEHTLEKTCNYSILEEDTTICKGETVQLSIVKPIDTTCFSWDNNTVQYYLKNGAAPNPAGFPDSKKGGYIELGTFGQQELFSISMWVKVPDVQPNTYGVLLDCSHGGSRNWVVQTLDGGKKWSWNDLDFTLKPNEWQHVQFVYNKGTKNIYVNGERIANNSEPIRYSGIPSLTLGNWREGGRRFKGCIDEVYITLEEHVFAANNLPKRIEKPSHTAFGLWHFDEGSGESTMNALNNNVTLINNWIWNKYPDQSIKSNPLYEWSTGQKDPVITVTPTKTSTYYLTTSYGSISYIDSVTINVSESNVDIFGYTKVHEKQVNHSYYTAFHEGSTYNWEISGNAVIASNNGGSSILVSFTKPGLAYLKVTETNKEGCIADTMLTITVHSLTSVDEGTMGAHVNIFPNPVNQEDAITVRTMLSPNGKGFVELLDMMGKQLYLTSTHAGDSFEQFTTTIPVASLSNGMYVIRIHDGDRCYIEKILINR